MIDTPSLILRLNTKPNKDLRTASKDMGVITFKSLWDPLIYEEESITREGFWEIKESSFKEYPNVITGEK